MFRKRHPPVGARPGTLVINSLADKPRIHVIEYTTEHVKEREVSDVAELGARRPPDAVTWVDVQGLGDELVLRALGDVFGLHPLALEDIVNVPQRPKVEPYDEHVLFVGRLAAGFEANDIKTEQLSLFVGHGFVLTFQERHGTTLEPVRTRIRQGKGAIRKLGPDYLAYAIVDTLIDSYYPVLEAVGEALEDLEDEIVAAATRATLHRVFHLRRELLALRRAVWPLREAMHALVRDDVAFFSDPVRVYLQDCYDHCIQIVDVLETYRELAGGLMDVYLSSIANRQNEVMRVLTIMASIFIPLTFMAGVYGMNFANMPELSSPWGYPVLLLAMAVVALGMVIYFRRKRWIATRDGTSAPGDSAP